MACKIGLLHLRIRHALARLIHPGVEEGLDLQPRGGRGATESAQHGAPRAPGCARPMLCGSGPMRMPGQGGKKRYGSLRFPISLGWRLS